MMSLYRGKDKLTGEWLVGRGLTKGTGRHAKAYIGLWVAGLYQIREVYRMTLWSYYGGWRPPAGDRWHPSVLRVSQTQDREEVTT